MVFKELEESGSKNLFKISDDLNSDLLTVISFIFIILATIAGLLLISTFGQIPKMIFNGFFPIYFSRLIF